MHSAVLDRHEEVVKELLDHRADTFTADFKGRTALHLAAQGYSLGILRLLLERGADMAARDGEGMTPLQFAYQKGVTRMIDYLIEKGVLGIDSHRGWTHIGDGFVWGDSRVLYYLLYLNPPAPLYSHPIQPWLAGCGKGGSFKRG